MARIQVACFFRFLEKIVTFFETELKFDQKRGGEKDVAASLLAIFNEERLSMG